MAFPDHAAGPWQGRSHGLPATALQRSRPPLFLRSRSFAGGSVTGEPDRYPGGSLRPRLLRIPRLERAAAGTGLGTIGRTVQRRAAAGPLDANLHGQRRAIPGAVLSAFSARSDVRQADGG